MANLVLPSDQPAPLVLPSDQQQTLMLPSDPAHLDFPDGDLNHAKLTNLVLPSDMPPKVQPGQPMHQPSAFSSGNDQPGPDNPDWQFTKALAAPGTGVVSEVGKGLQKTGQFLYEAPEAAMAHTIDEFEPLPPGMSNADLAKSGAGADVPIEDTIHSLPAGQRAFVGGVKGLVESAPQMAIAAADPVAGALAFGATPEGFDPKQAAIALALPVIGKYAGAVTEAMATKAGVSSDLAQAAFNKMGGAAGAAGLLGADQVRTIMQLPPDQRKDALIDAAGNVGSMFLLGTMGERHQLGKESTGPSVLDQAKTLGSNATDLALSIPGNAMRVVNPLSWPRAVAAAFSTEAPHEDVAEPGPVSSDAAQPAAPALAEEPPATPLAKYPPLVARMMADMQPKNELTTIPNEIVQNPVSPNGNTAQVDVDESSEKSPTPVPTIAQKAATNPDAPLTASDGARLESLIADLKQTMQANQVKPLSEKLPIISDNKPPSEPAKTPVVSQPSPPEAVKAPTAPAASTAPSQADLDEQDRLETAKDAVGLDDAQEARLAELQKKNATPPPPPIAAPETAAATPASPAAARPSFFIRPRSDDVHDILDEVQIHGGIKAPGPLDVGGEYDGYREAMTGTAQLLRRRSGGLKPDDMVANVQENFPRIKSADDLYDAIRQANAQREQLRTNGGGHEAQTDRFWQAVSKPENLAGFSKITVDTLTVGRKFRVKAPGMSHDELTVSAIDPDTGEVTVKDGPTFGTQDLPAGTPIYIRKGSLKQPDAQHAAGDFKAPNYQRAVNETGGMRPGSVMDEKMRAVSSQFDRRQQSTARPSTTHDDAVQPDAPEDFNATGTGRGLSIEDATAAIHSVLGTKGELPAGIRVVRDETARWGAKIEGRDQITVNAAQISSPERARAVIMEEGFHGVWKDPALQRAWQSVRDLVTPEEMAAEHAKRAAQGLPTDAATIREEAAIARLVKADANRGVFARVMDAARSAFKRVFGFDLPGSDRQVLKDAAIKFLKSREGWYGAKGEFEPPKTAHIGQLDLDRMPGQQRLFAEGDDEKRAQIERLPALPIRAKTIEESAAKMAYKDLPPTQTPDGRTVEFVHGIFGKLARHQDNGVLLRAIPQFGELLENSVHVFPEQENNPPANSIIRQFHNYVSKLEADGREYFIRFSVQELRDERNQLHNARVTDAEIIRADTGSLSKSIDMATGTQRGSDEKLRDWWHNVKHATGDVQPPEDGKPRLRLAKDAPAGPPEDWQKLKAESDAANARSTAANKAIMDAQGSPNVADTHDLESHATGGKSAVTRDMLDERRAAQSATTEAREKLLRSPGYIGDAITRYAGALKQLEAAKAVGEPTARTAARQTVEEFHNEFAQMPQGAFAEAWKAAQDAGTLPKTIQAPVGRSLRDLTAKLETSDIDSPKVPLLQRLAIGRTIANSLEGAKGAYDKAARGVRATWEALKSGIYDPPKDDDFRNVMKDWFAADQQTGHETYRWIKAIESKISDPVRRKAASAWLDALGDDDTLRAQLADLQTAAGGKHVPVWDAALKLTESEKSVLRDIRADFETKLEDAKNVGMIDKGRENYGVPQVWKVAPKTDEASAGKGNAGNFRAKLDPRDPFFSLQREVPSYFDGIMRGGEPKDMDVGKLVAVYNEAFHKNLSSRAAIWGLKDAHSRDGQTPVVKISGDAHYEVLPTGGKRLLVDSGRRPGDAVTTDGRPYRAIDHWALNGWQYKGSDPAGNPVLVKGNFLVHPDHWDFLNNELNGAKWRQAQPVTVTRNGVDTVEMRRTPLGALGHGALSVSSFLKSSKMALGMFHLFNVGTHSLPNGVSPITSGFKIDFNDPKQAEGIRNGLELGFGGNRVSFEEGQTGAHGGLWSHVPGLGAIAGRMTDFIFKDALPKMKMKNYLALNEANTARYGRELTSDQISEISAHQANAAFGLQNYRLLGSSKVLMDMNRLVALAPDFLGSELKQTAQAFTKFGGAQRRAIFVQAAAMYALARVINASLNNGDSHWEPENALSVIYKGRTYSIRSVVADMFHMISDPAGFAAGRLGPLPHTIADMITGRDMRFGTHIDTISSGGISRATEIALRDAAGWLAPIGTDGFGPGAAKRGESPAGTLAAAQFGLSSRQYTAQTQMYDAAGRFNRSNPDPKAQEYQATRDADVHAQSAFKGLDNLLNAGDAKAAKAEYQNLIEEGHSPKSIATRYGRVATPFTGSREREAQFFASLNPGQQKTYQDALMERRLLAEKFGRIITTSN